MTRFLSEQAWDVHDNSQFRDKTNRRFFLCTVFDSECKTEGLHEASSQLAKEYTMDWRIYEPHTRTRALIMVSMLGHCLVDLLYPHRVVHCPSTFL